MNLCNHSSALCGHDPECPDTMCEGRPMHFSLHRIPSLEEVESGIKEDHPTLSVAGVVISLLILVGSFASAVVWAVYR